MAMCGSGLCTDWDYLSMVITGKCIQEGRGAGIMHRLPVVIQRNPYTVNLSSNLRQSWTEHWTAQAQVKYLCQDLDHSH